MNLADRQGCIWCVVEHSVGIHKVKRTVRERQAFSVALHETSIQMCQLKTPARYAKRRVRQVDGRVTGACASEAFGLAAASATDFEHSQAASFFKAYRRL